VLGQVTLNEWVRAADEMIERLAALWGIAYEGRWDEPPPEGAFNDAPGLTLLRQLDARLAVIQKCIEGRNLERAQDDLYALRGAVQVALRPVVPGSENAEARRDA
jgi:hypothetical protein